MWGEAIDVSELYSKSRHEKKEEGENGEGCAMNSGVM